MKASGLVLVIFGGWVLCQVLGGNALGRLGITGSATKPGTPDVTGPIAPAQPHVQVPPGFVGG